MTVPDFPIQNWQSLPLGIIAALAVALGAALLVRAIFRKIRRTQRMVAAISSAVLLLTGGTGITYSFVDLQNSVDTFYQEQVKSHVDNARSVLGK